MTTRAIVSIVAGAVIVLGCAALVRRIFPAMGELAVNVIAGVASLPLMFFLVRQVINRGLRASILAVSDGLLSLAEKDYGMRLVAVRSDEVGTLVHRFNRLAARLRHESNDSYQKEILLETVLGASSIAVVITNEAKRIVYANAAAREFFAAGRRLEGQDFGGLMCHAPEDVKEAASAPSDVIFSCNRGGAPEMFHLSKRYFELSTQRHTVYMLRPLTRELERKEADTWKKAIRVISHEMNNSLAPITSLVHSARLMLKNPEHAHRLTGALDTIEDRAKHLKTFLDGYASFARLPMPVRKETAWRDLLAGVEGLYRFRVDGDVPTAPVSVDAGQIQQVLINLLKNAAEAGSPPEEIVIAFSTTPDGGIEFQVMDRGRGMPREVLQNALLPFYSTKKSGTGLGLALCREIVEAHGGHLSLQPRDGGGMSVRCWLPA